MRLDHREPCFLNLLFWEVIVKGWLGAIEQAYCSVLVAIISYCIYVLGLLFKAHLDIMKLLQWSLALVSEEVLSSSRICQTADIDIMLDPAF